MSIRTWSFSRFEKNDKEYIDNKSMKSPSMGVFEWANRFAKQAMLLLGIWMTTHALANEIPVHKQVSASGVMGTVVLKRRIAAQGIMDALSAQRNVGKQIVKTTLPELQPIATTKTRFAKVMRPMTVTQFMIENFGTTNGWKGCLVDKNRGAIVLNDRADLRQGHTYILAFSPEKAQKLSRLIIENNRTKKITTKVDVLSPTQLATPLVHAEDGKKNSAYLNGFVIEQMRTVGFESQDSTEIANLFKGTAYPLIGPSEFAIMVTNVESGSGRNFLTAFDRAKSLIGVAREKEINNAINQMLNSHNDVGAAQMTPGFVDNERKNGISFDGPMIRDNRRMKITMRKVLHDAIKQNIWHEAVLKNLEERDIRFSSVKLPHVIIKSHIRVSDDLRHRFHLPPQDHLELVAIAYNIGFWNACKVAKYMLKTGLSIEAGLRAHHLRTQDLQNRRKQLALLNGWKMQSSYIISGVALLPGTDGGSNTLIQHAMVKTSYGIGMLFWLPKGGASAFPRTTTEKVSSIMAHLGIPEDTEDKTIQSIMQIQNTSTKKASVLNELATNDPNYIATPQLTQIMSEVNRLQNRLQSRPHLNQTEEQFLRHTPQYLATIGEVRESIVYWAQQDKKGTKGARQALLRLQVINGHLHREIISQYINYFWIYAQNEDSVSAKVVKNLRDIASTVEKKIMPLDRYVQALEQKAKVAEWYTQNPDKAA